MFFILKHMSYILRIAFLSFASRSIVPSDFYFMNLFSEFILSPTQMLWIIDSQFKITTNRSRSYSSWTSFCILEIATFCACPNRFIIFFSLSLFTKCVSLMLNHCCPSFCLGCHRKYLIAIIYKSKYMKRKNSYFE